MRRFTLAIGSILAMTSFFVSSSTSDVSSQIKQSIAAAGKAVKVPNSNAVVVFEHSGQVVLITDNPRYVVKGQLFDMWENTKLENSGELKASSLTIPLDRLPLDDSQIFKMTTNKDNDKKLTVFINPFDKASRKQIELIIKYANSYQIDWVFVSVEGTKEDVDHLLKLSCIVSNEQPDDILEMFIQNNISIPNKHCQKESVIKTFAFTRFLNITTLPTFVASNNVASQGMPPKLISWLANNME